MTRYGVWLYAQQTDELCGRYVECGKKEIPRMLARFVLEYIKNALYPGAITATVIAGRIYTEYILLLNNDILDVCLHVLQADRAEVQEPLDREESAR